MGRGISGGVGVSGPELVVGKLALSGVSILLGLG